MVDWGRFDFRCALAYTGYADRQPAIDAEIARVGLTDVHRVWQFPNPFYSTLRAKVRRSRSMAHPGHFSCTLGHYRAVKTAYELGARRCLVMEDDIRFLTDVGLLAEIVSDMPDDLDIALLDVLKPQATQLDAFVRTVRENRIGRFWARGTNLRSCGCYSMNRRGMARFIACYESPVAGRAGLLRQSDQFFNVAHIGSDVRIGHAVPCGARQVVLATGSNSGYTDLDGWYRAVGCDPSAYGPAASDKEKEQ